MPEILFANLSAEEQALARLSALQSILPKIEGEADDVYMDRLVQFGKIASASADGISGLTDMTDALFAARVNQMDTEVERRTAEHKLEVQRTTRVLQMTTSYIDGSVGNHALPVQSSDMQDFLDSLNHSQLEAAHEIFTNILDAGLLPFDTIGTGAENDLPKQPLPPELTRSLDTWLSTESNTVEEWFDINSDLLLPMEQYELGKYKKVEV